MPSENLVDLTRAVFPRLSEGEIAIEPLLKGGSDRCYYRMRMSDAHSMILVKYGDHVAENAHYVAIDRFLDGLGIRVPRIYYHDEKENLIWMEDLGAEDLWAHRNEVWETRRDLYCRTLDQALKLHSATSLAALPMDLQLQGEFNAELYLWEQNYFFDHCLAGHFGIAREIVDRESLEVLARIAAKLGCAPRTLVHRDFQSQNVLIIEGEACLIDFQGLRPGLLHYDLASLLYDPYVSLAPEERQELLEYYTAGAVDAGIALSNDFDEIFRCCAMQRLMQALGAYGFLGHKRGREDFLAHIPVAIASLREVLDQIPGTESLRGVIDTCLS